MTTWLESSNTLQDGTPVSRRIKIPEISEEVWFTDNAYAEVSDDVADILANNIGSISKVSEPTDPGTYYNDDNANTTIEIIVEDGTFDALTAESVDADTATITATDTTGELQTQRDVESWYSTRGGPVATMPPAASLFEDLSEWYVSVGSLSASTNNVYRGSQSGHLTSPDSDTAVIRYTFSSAVDLTNINPSISARSPVDKLLRVEVRYRDSNGNTVTHRNLYAQKNAVGEWARHDLGVSNDGGVDLTAVSEVDVRIITNDGSNGIDVYLDDLRFVEGLDKGIVILTYDDGRSSVYENALPNHEKYGLPGGIGVMTGSVGDSGYMTWDQIGEFEAAGWDVNNHQVTNTDLTGMTESEVDEQLRPAKRELIENGVTNGLDVVYYRGGNYDTTAVEATEKHADLAFTTGSKSSAVTSPAPTSPLTMNRWFPRSDTAGVSTMLDYAETYNDLLVLGWHTVGTTDDEITTADHDSVLSDIVSRNLTVLTPSQFAATQSNHW
ncbi:polysaccharide deacetylase family protein [Natrialba taiwanensis]|uniref:Polysaccharide deacetylase n=1 Tax=Natrialba taiwanensis DSM 12281 TaxID=1230458 RepID=L9ZYA4_9EURY|nr:polysaccharide deacetylase family protein [Natrialba taiwanensis]ELY91485.1 polysaccharide deacetylase [Natrialba taiwanensis DSM 12281]